MAFEKREDGAILVQRERRREKDVEHPSHNFTDPTTWWGESIRVTGETLTGGPTDFNSVQTNWIDLTHGKVARENRVSIGEPSGHGYSVRIYANGVEKTERAAFKSSGGHYSVNYATGVVTFFSAPSTPVTADYSHTGSGAAGSKWTLAPTSGKRLDLESAVVYFSKDIDFNELTIIQEFWTGANKDKTIIYKTVGNFLVESMASWTIPTMNTSPDQGTSQDLIALKLRFESVIQLLDSTSQKITIRLSNVGNMLGGFAMATFHGTSHTE